MGQFAVIGLGAFGSNVVKRLFKNNHDVIAIDREKEVVESLEDYCAQAILADATDRETLEAIGLESVDAAIVAIGSNIAASTLATLHLRDLGVRHIIVKAISADHEKILQKIGANEIIDPEKDMAERLADRLGHPNLIEKFPFGEGYSVAELISPPLLWGKTLAESNIRAKYGVAVIAIKAMNPDRTYQMNIAPAADDKIHEGDILMIIGEDSKLDKFRAL
ncbi:MAG: TrkA family potassium uptake protein [Deltaproteobacteria bacterium]|nr:TrkA family potassium uptake protein [Deltaproteobacteria bacterium]